MKYTLISTKMARSYMNINRVHCDPQWLKMGLISHAHNLLVMKLIWVQQRPTLVEIHLQCLGLANLVLE